MKEILMSVIIPARNEWPQIVYTIYSLWHAWETSGYDRDQMEIIIVNNCSTDRQYPRTALSGTVEYLMPRSSYSSRYLRVMYDPIAGNHSARNKGARMARGKYMFISDAHMAYAPEMFKWLIKAIDESGGIVHCPIGWLGAYPPKESSLGHAYTVKIGEEGLKGTWAQRCLTQDDWFYIPALGHCSLGMRRDQFLDFGGYPEIHRTYGGGEMYVNMKWWMFGAPVVCEPRAIGYHMSSERGYVYHHDDYIHNLFNVTYAIGADDWLERTYINYLRRGRKSTLDRLMAEAKVEMQDDRDKIARRRKWTYNEVLVNKPWDQKNMEKFGRTNQGVLIYNQSWFELMQGASENAKEALKNSKHQKGLYEFIESSLKEHVYRRGEYGDETYEDWIKKL